MGAFFAIGGARGGGSGGIEDDGAHKLTTPETVLSEYKLFTKDSEGSGTDTAEDLAKSGVKNGTAVSGIYSTADLSDYDPSDPSTAPDPSEIATAKGITYIGAYGEIADPEKSLDEFFALIKKESQDNSSASGSTAAPKTEMVGEPEAVEIDGAVMKCQAAKGTNLATQKAKTDWFCAWADYSTMAMVSPVTPAKA